MVNGSAGGVNVQKMRTWQTSPEHTFEVFRGHEVNLESAHRVFTPH